MQGGGGGDHALSVEREMAGNRGILIFRKYLSGFCVKAVKFV